MNILTQNPEVWKKTIFILTYDENDGYFDHVPPFVAPDPRRPETGEDFAGGGGARPSTCSRARRTSRDRSGWATACRWSWRRRGAAAGM